MKLGLVSNCWQHLLSSGVSIELLCQQALERGYSYIELRQTCLGDCETSEHLPIPSRLKQLAASVPKMAWNLAINVPIFSEDLTNSDLFQRAIQAAVALDPLQPHLRIVDLTTVVDLPDVDDVAQRVSSAVHSMAEVGGILSLEHSIQPWGWFMSGFQGASDLLGEDSHRLKLCYDACNLLIPPDDIAPNNVSESLSVEQLSMIHFKQRQEGTILPTMDVGDIDWERQLEIWAAKQYQGPALFEIAPSESVWKRLEESQHYLFGG